METPFDPLPLTGWYPGHMHKAGKQMDEALKLVDLAVELVDARAPSATRNPDLEARTAHRPFMILGNKADLADPGACRLWQNWFRRQGIAIRFLEAARGSQVRQLPELWKKMVQEARMARGATRPLMRPVRIMISGVPNVGKSTLVNHLLERKKAQVGPRPGVTRQTQWIPLSGGVELLDTPGVLWPDISSKPHELTLALLNIMNEELVPARLQVEYLLWQWNRLNYPVPWEKLGCRDVPVHGEAFLEQFARARNFLQKGGILDLERAAVTVLRDFRSGKLGKITLETPPVEKDDTKDSEETESRL